MGARERTGCLQAPAIGNITHGGLGSGPQGTAPLPTVVGLAGRAGLKNVGLGLTAAILDQILSTKINTNLTLKLISR